MKRPHNLFLAVLFLITVILTSCSFQNRYEEAYWEGFSAGYDEAEFDLANALDEKFLEGYDFGYEDGQNDVWDELGEEYEYRAVRYARDKTGWSPEEACMIIDAYREKKPFYADGSLPSAQEYLEAIDCLMHFYDYFYSRMYK